MYAKFFKRPIDFLGALILITLLLPIYLVLYVLIIIFLGKPAIFRQERPGKDEKIFEVMKFRSMTNETDKDGNLLPDAQRLTKFGWFLRKSSLDEIPQLFNVLKGDMSFIGPRPLLVRYLHYYNEEEKRRHNVRPGITGLAQVNGRNAISWKAKFAYDIKYVDNITFLGDVKIVLQTIQKVLKRSDITIGGGDFFDVERKREMENAQEKPE